jgi:hypothetical protein
MNADVIKLIARPSRPPTLLTSGPVGQRMIFAHDLFIDGEKVGFDRGVSTVMRAKDGSVRMVCNINLRLRDGTITLHRVVEDDHAPTPLLTSVAAGTGIYRDACGEMYIFPASPQENCYRLYLRS